MQDVISLEKPITMPIKHWLIKHVAQRLEIKEDVVERVVNHQFEGALNALSSCYSIEFSGFGKLYFNKTRAAKKMKKLVGLKEYYEKLLADETTSDTKRKSATYKLAGILENIECLKTKINEV